MTNQPLTKVFLLLTIGALALSACNLSASEPTPTQVSLEVVYTSAAQTVEAQLTGTAAAQPTATFTPSPTPPPTQTPTPAATNTTIPTLPPTSSSGGGGSTAVGCNDARFVADVTIPDGQQMAPGTAFTKTWRVQNSGTCAWNANYKLTFVSGDGMSGVTTPINQTVNPGGIVDVSVALTAPATPKTYIGYWRLATDGGQAFGTSLYVQIVVSGTPVTPGTGTVFPSITPTFGAVGCYNAALVSANPPDGVSIAPGDSFRKTWIIKNTGTCEWNDNFRFAFVSGDILRDNTTNRLRRGTIKPGGTIEYSLDFTAPLAPGTYTSIWRLMTDTGTFFGPSFTSQIIVPGATFTRTPTASTTPSPAPGTPTPSATPVPPTNTPVPTDTPTPSPTP
ncbi:MAG: NBR1-Ig-like domain-containing protein [Anaerolineales bacterium]|nr:NBR1-Ig-like domain-containing protein [Anaerolineales bacterium]